MSLQACPLEVVRLIVAEIKDRRTNRSLLYTCRILHAQAQPLIYENIDFTSARATTASPPSTTHPEGRSDVIRLLHRTIVLHESPCARYVRSFSLDHSVLSDSGISRVNRILERLSNLKSFAFGHPGFKLKQPGQTSWIIFPCLRHSPPPFQLTRFVWGHPILDDSILNEFLQHQSYLTELSILTRVDAESRASLPPTTRFNLSVLRTSLDWLHIFPPGSITSLQIPFLNPGSLLRTPNSRQAVVDALSNLCAISCPMHHPLSTLLDNPQIMPKLEFVEMSSATTLPYSDGDRFIEEFSQRHIRYLRLPSQHRLLGSPLHNPTDLFSRITSLECVDYYPPLLTRSQLRRIAPLPEDILSPPSAEDVTEMQYARWRRNATAPVLITLPPRRLCEWELDLNQDE